MKCSSKAPRSKSKIDYKILADQCRKKKKVVSQENIENRDTSLLKNKYGELLDSISDFKGFPIEEVSKVSNTKQKIVESSSSPSKAIMDSITFKKPINVSNKNNLIPNQKKENNQKALVTGSYQFFKVISIITKK